MRTKGIRLTLLVPALALLSVGRPAVAQREGYSYLAYVGSDVSLISTASDDQTARVNTPVMPGDSIQTGGSSRAEVILADGGVLRIDSRTGVRFDRLAKTYESEDDRDLFYLEKGAVSIETRSGVPRDSAPRIDTDDVTVVVPDRSVVRIDAGKRGSEVYVLSGRAEISSRSGRAIVRSNEYAYVSGDDPIEVDSGVFPRDRFTRFVEERRERSSRGNRVRYVSGDYAYDYDQADFDEYGSWTYASGYDSYCWRPRVAAGWVPYSNGYWRWTPSGLTWVSYDPWGWLPSHYGTWVYDDTLGWVWLPGDSYSPAWVYWSYLPDWVGWCPIGFYGYYGGYYSWCRDWYPHHRRFDLAYPHLAGRVDISRIDRKGWNFVRTGRFGSHLEPRDVVRGDRAGFAPGLVGVVSTSPLRIDRNGKPTMTLAVQEAVRRVTKEGPLEGTRGARALNENLTDILRRDANLPPAAREEFRKSIVRAGSDPAYRPQPALAIAEGRRPLTGKLPAPSGALPHLEGAPGRGSDAWRDTASSRPRLDREQGRRGGAPDQPAVLNRSNPSNAWREKGPGRNDLGRAPAPRSDDGWRSPSPPRSFDAPSPRDVPRDVGSPGRSEPPRAAEPRRGSLGPRQMDSPRTYQSAPRVAESRRGFAPKQMDSPRGYGSSRSQVSPRNFASPRSAPSYGGAPSPSRGGPAPSRGGPAPSFHSAPAAPAPHGGGPHRG